MLKRLHIFILFYFSLFGILKSQNQEIFIKGLVLESGTGQAIENVAIKVSNSSSAAITNGLGKFNLSLPKKNNYKLTATHLSYQSFIKEIKTGSLDTIHVTLFLQQRSNLLDSVSVYALHKPETLVGKPNYSVFDFDFYEDKLL